RRLWLSLVVLAAYPVSSHAGGSADPLRAVPAQAELILKLEDPRRLVDTIYHLDAVKEALKIDLIKELYDTTTARRFFQLAGYFEKELGHPYPELLDRLAGGGVVLAVNLTTKPAHPLLVIEAKDKELLQKFAQVGLKVAEQELARLDLKSKLKKTTH